MTPRSKGNLTASLGIWVAILSFVLLPLWISFMLVAVGYGLYSWGRTHVWRAGYRDGYGSGKGWEFVCSDCGVKIAEQKYIGNNNMPMCQNCAIWDTQKKRDS